MADFEKGKGEGIDTQGISLIGNVVFCDRAGCVGNYDLNSQTNHGKCLEKGVPDEGVDIEIVSEEFSDALVQRETAPNKTLIKLGLVAVSAAEIIMEPLVGPRYRTKILERLFSA
jgi:hypothetical protein